MSYFESFRILILQNRTLASNLEGCCFLGAIDVTLKTTKVEKVKIIA